VGVDQTSEDSNLQPSAVGGWAQGQAEFLGAVIVAGEHPHLAATVQNPTPTPEGTDDLVGGPA